MAFTESESQAPGAGYATRLSDERYTECVEIYEAASNQRGLLQQALINQLREAYAGQSMRMLSVGSGSGEFDAPVLEQLQPHLATIAYTGVDPNSSQCDLARQRLAPLARAGVAIEVYDRGFDADCVDGGFDVVHFVHSLYYFTDPDAAVDAALAFLAPGGRLVFGHAPNEELNTLAARFWALDQGQSSWFSGDIQTALAARGLACGIERIDAKLDASGCPGRDGVAATATGHAVADFIAQVDIAGLPAATRAEAYTHLGRIIRERPDCGDYFPHPVDLITVVSDASRSESVYPETPPQPLRPTN